MFLSLLRVLPRLSLIAGFVVIISLLLRRVSLDSQDPYKCRALLECGKWLDNHNRTDEEHVAQKWQPPGCMFHKYTSSDIERCLQCQRMVFIGDSTTRQIFWATARKLDHDRANEAAMATEKHGNIEFVQGCTKLDFFWDPFLNTSSLHSELEMLNSSSNRTTSVSGQSKAVVILVGGGLWHAGYLEDQTMDKEWLQSLEMMSQISGYGREKITPETTPSVIKPPAEQNLLLLAPVLMPCFDRLSPSRQLGITRERVLTLNSHLDAFSSTSGIQVPRSFSSLISDHPAAYELDGVHVIDSIADRQADIVLNMRCNSAPSMQVYPFNKTCCTYRPRFVWLQWLSGLGTLALLLHAHYLAYTCRWESDGREELAAFEVLCAALCSCFSADRTWLFENTNKYPNEIAFVTLCGIALLLGLLTIGKAPRGKTGPMEFLSRSQTEEFRGWMQVMILFYHYSGMSAVLWVYKIVRVLVAAYLFLTGFGHTIYFCTTNNYSLRRVSFVLIRLNTLAYLLSLLMRTNFDFYYFPALSSFWFLNVYITCRFRNRVCRHPSVLYTNIIGSAVLTTILVLTPGILEHVLWALQIFSRKSMDVKEFRFRVALDLYITYIGMMAAALYLQVSGPPPFQDECFWKKSRKRMSALRLPAIFMSLISLPTFFVVVQHCPNKYDYNQWHPYISWIPILSFVILRNGHSTLRQYHSRLFSWVGRCSLETFVLQYHIWLAGDTKGLLRLGLLDRDDTNGLLGTYNDHGNWKGWTEFLIMTIYFLAFSWAASEATNIVTLWFVGRLKDPPRIFTETYENGEWCGTAILAEIAAGNGRKRSVVEAERQPRCTLSAGWPQADPCHTRWWDLSMPGVTFTDDRIRLRVAALVGIVWVVNWMVPSSSN